MRRFYENDVSIRSQFVHIVIIILTIGNIETCVATHKKDGLMETFHGFINDINGVLWSYVLVYLDYVHIML